MPGTLLPDIWILSMRSGTNRVPKRQTGLMALFGITPEEIEAAGTDRVTALVLERVALLDVSK